MPTMRAACVATLRVAVFIGRRTEAVGMVPDTIRSLCSVFGIEYCQPNTGVKLRSSDVDRASSASTPCWTAPSLERRHGHRLVLLLGERGGRKHRDHELPIPLVEHSDLIARQRRHMKSPHAV